MWRIKTSIQVKHLPVLKLPTNHYIGDEESGLQQCMILDDMHTRNTGDMATALPAFPEFDVSETSTQATRWKKWLSRFWNLMVAVNVTNKLRQRALLLHYAGEATNEIFDTLPDTVAGEGGDPFEKAVQALTNYFTPKQNREYEIYVFLQAKQESNESISSVNSNTDF